MSQPANPAAGTVAATTHVHHPGPTGQQGPTATSTQPTDQLAPEDYKNPVVADFMVTTLPDNIIYVNGLPEAAPTAAAPPPAPVLTREQAARGISNDVYDGLTTKPETLWSVIDRLIQLGFLQSQIDPRVVRVGLPFNSPQVVAGGMAMIRVVQSDKKAKNFGVDISAMGQDIAAAARINQARAVLEPAFRVTDANETVVLSRVADRVNQGLTVGGSMIKSDAHLSWLLKPATDIRGEPTGAGVANRAQNARTEDAIRADEQQKAQASAAPPAVPQTAVSVTTATSPAVGDTPAAGPKTAVAGGHKSTKK